MCVCILFIAGTVIDLFPLSPHPTPPLSLHYSLLLHFLSLPLLNVSLYTYNYFSSIQTSLSQFLFPSLSSSLYLSSFALSYLSPSLLPISSSHSFPSFIPPSLPLSLSHPYLSSMSSTVKHSGSITFDDVLNIARTMRPRSMAKDLSGTVKEILGTAQSVGCKVDGRHPHDVIEDIQSGEIVVEVSLPLS